MVSKDRAMGNSSNNTKGQAINMVALPEEEWKKMQEKQDRLEALLLKNQEEAFLNRWVESEVARKQLGVCQKTWQTMRDNRTLPFSQFGRRIYVRQSDLDAFLEANLVGAK